MQEHVEIVFRDVERNPAIEQQIEERVSQLEKYCDHITSCQVAVERPHKHQESGSGFRVRVLTRVPPEHELVADEHPSQGSIQDELTMVIRRSFEAMERQLKKLVNQQREYHRNRPEEEGVGIVTTIDKQKRFGIVKTPAGRDVFFNDRAVVGGDFDLIEAGTAVRYVDQPGPEGPRASTIQVVDRRGQPIVRQPPADPHTPRPER